MLNEAELDALQTKYRKIGAVTWEDHQLVFRRPTVDEVSAYVQRRDNPAERAFAQRLVAQQLIVAFDGETDPTKARMAYTSQFIVDYPLFPNAPEVGALLSVLMGSSQEEEIEHLGKVVSVRSERRRRTRAASPNGSATAPAPQTSSPSLAESQQS